MTENGQNPESKDDAALGQTALGWAAFIGHEDVVDHLTGKGAINHRTGKSNCQ